MLKAVAKQRFLFRPASAGRQVEAFLGVRSSATEDEKAKKLDKKINS